MDGSNFIRAVSCGFKEPLLIGVSGFIPLDNFTSDISTFSSNIKAESIQNTLNEITFIVLHPFPSLVEPSVYLVLNYSLSGLEN